MENGAADVYIAPYSCFLVKSNTDVALFETFAFLFDNINIRFAAPPVLGAAVQMDRVTQSHTRKHN